jgi:hypothetical protein
VCQGWFLAAAVYWIAGQALAFALECIPPAAEIAGLKRWLPFVRRLAPIILEIGFVDVVIAPPVDTFAGAGSEKNARRLGLYGYAFVVRKPG